MLPAHAHNSITLPTHAHYSITLLEHAHWWPVIAADRHYMLITEVHSLLNTCALLDYTISTCTWLDYLIDACALLDFVTGICALQLYDAYLLLAYLYTDALYNCDAWFLSHLPNLVGAIEFRKFDSDFYRVRTFLWFWDESMNFEYLLEICIFPFQKWRWLSFGWVCAIRKIENVLHMLHCAPLNTWMVEPVRSQFVVKIGNVPLGWACQTFFFGGTNR